jgi:hypothetical protein
MQTPMLFLCASLVMTEAAEFRSQASGPALKKVAEFDLPGPPGKRFDYLMTDPDDHT